MTTSNAFSSRSDDPKEYWPVKVFRRTDARGWEMCGWDNTRNDDPLTAAPRKGCIEVKKIRLRLYLFADSKPSKGESGTNKTPMTNGSNKIAVIRRLDTILITRKTGTIVLKFVSRGECLSFSDQLVSLNRDYIPTMHEPPRISPLNEEAMGRNYYIDSSHDHPADTNGSKTSSLSRVAPKKRKRVHRLDEGKEEKEDPTSSLSRVPEDDLMHASRKETIISYMVRTLHDDSFIGLVDSIEATLAASQGCDRIFAALGEPR